MEGCGSAASIEGVNAPYEDWLRQYFYPLPVPNTKRISYKRFVHTSGVRSEKPQLPRFGTMFLDEERGRYGPGAGRAQSAPSMEGVNAPYKDWLRQYFYPLLNPPIKNEPPI